MGDSISQSASLIGKISLAQQPVNRAPFRNLEGWKFDEHRWASKKAANTNIRLPLASEIDSSNIPKSFFLSGSRSGLELIDVTPSDEQSFTGWTPGVTPGYYSVFNFESFLHSQSAITMVFRGDIDPDSSLYNVDMTPIDGVRRSQMFLKVRPSLINPVSVSTLKRDPDTLAIDFEMHFNQVPIFTGKASETGIEMDGDDVFNTDRTKNEFKLVANDSDLVKHLPLRVGTNVVISSGIARVELDEYPCLSRRPELSRQDLFKDEISMSKWMERQSGVGDALEFGTYTIGYNGTLGEGNIFLYLGGRDVSEFGTITYQPVEDWKIIFNKDVAVQHSDVVLTMSVSRNEGVIYYLPSFPALDCSSTSDEISLGDIILDDVNTIITIDDEVWTRVPSLQDIEEGDEQKVYELRPLSGEIIFGNSGVPQDGVQVWGTKPNSNVYATWKSVPLVRYDTPNSTELFSDDTVDLDPLANAMKSGFLMLDSQRPIPWKIELMTTNPYHISEDGSIVYGRLKDNEFEGLETPSSSDDDIGSLIAKVSDKTGEGIPNVPVIFETSHSSGFLSQEAAVTNSDGLAFSELYGSPIFENFTTKSRFYKALPDWTDEIYLNPDPSTLQFKQPIRQVVTLGTPNEPMDWNDEAPPWTQNTLILEGHIEGDPSDIYLFIVSVPGDDGLDNYDSDPQLAAECPSPYNAVNETGGLLKVWTKETDGALQIVHPVHVDTTTQNVTRLVFDRKIPLPVDPNIANPPRNLIMGYDVVIDRSVRVKARTIDPKLWSNDLEFLLTLNPTMKGQWRLPIIIGEMSDGFRESEPEEEVVVSSRISTATYLSPNDFEVTDLQDEGHISTATITPGNVLNIIGNNFPIDEETRPSIYIMKIQNGRVISLKDITSAASLISSTEIRIAVMPAPPTGIAGNYFIVVGGLLPSDALSPYTSLTAKEITIEG